MASVVKRTYDASGRRASARRRREKVLDQAERLFLRRGFSETTVASIAAAAEVSPETVYKSYGGKVGLVRALQQRALQGTGPVAAEQRSDRLRQSADPHDLVRGWATLATEVAPRVTPILLLVRDAALVEPRMRAVQDELDESRLVRMRDNAEFLCSAGLLQAGVTVTDAASLLWAVSAPEMFELLVMRRKWPLSRYANWLYGAIRGILHIEVAESGPDPTR